MRHCNRWHACLSGHSCEPPDFARSRDIAARNGRRVPDVTDPCPHPPDGASSARTWCACEALRHHPQPGTVRSAHRHPRAAGSAPCTRAYEVMSRKRSSSPSALQLVAPAPVAVQVHFRVQGANRCCPPMRSNSSSLRHRLRAPSAASATERPVHTGRRRQCVPGGQEHRGGTLAGQ